MSYMFSDCYSLTSLDLSNFIILLSKIWKDYLMVVFLLSNFYTNKVENLSYTFSDCSSLTSLDLSLLI